MNSLIDVLFLRKPKIDYISPPVCEVIFSAATGFGITLNPLLPLVFPTGLLLGGVGGFLLRWDVYPGALCYSVYRSDTEFGDYTIVAECIPDNGISLAAFGPGFYSVTAITLDGETPLSGPAHWATNNPPTVMSGGGSGSSKSTAESPPEEFWQLQWTTIVEDPGVPEGQISGTGGSSLFQAVAHQTGFAGAPDVTNGGYSGMMFYSRPLVLGPLRCQLNLSVNDTQTGRLSVWYARGTAYERVLLEIRFDTATSGIYEFDVPPSGGDFLEVELGIQTSHHEDAVWQGVFSAE